MINSNVTIQGVVDMLNVLGTPDNIALELESHNIKAVRRCSTMCAIAQYITKITGKVVMVNIGFIKNADCTGNTVWLEEGYEYSYDIDGEVLFNSPISQFIRSFDAGLYPNLVEESTIP